VTKFPSRLGLAADHVEESLHVDEITSKDGGAAILWFEHVLRK
jgi:hypothetical protein